MTGPSGKALFICMISIIYFSLSCLDATGGEKIETGKHQYIPAYPGMSFRKVISLKDGTFIKEYCSKDSAKFINRYYKRKYPRAVEIESGTRNGIARMLYLDISSPLQRRKSREWIRILTTKKYAGCRSIVSIRDKRKPARIKKAKPEKKLIRPKKKIIKAKPEKALRQWRESVLSIGANFNTVNFSAGPSITVWPHKNIGIQGNFGIGTFTSYEAKFFYKFNKGFNLLYNNIKPYLGAGYIYAEKEETILGLDTTISEESYSAFAGIEVPFSKKLSLYLDISGTPLELEKEVIVGSTKAIATVDYSPITINANMVYYLW